MIGEFVINYVLNMLNAKKEFSGINNPEDLEKRQELYLYSDSAISEKDFIIRKAEISKRLEDVRAKLGLVSPSSDSSLSDEDFIKQASHLLISRQLSERRYIYFKEFAKSVSSEILKTYLDTILDSVMIADGRVAAIVFRNELTHKFIYAKGEKKIPG